MTRASRAYGARVCVVLAITAGGPARAGVSSPGCLDGGEQATVAAVGDDLDLRLVDGRDLRLAGLDPVRPTALRPAAVEEARAALRAWLVGRAVRVAVIGPKPDRWGRTTALVFAPDPAIAGPDAPRVSVPEAMLDAGLARAKPDQAVASCWSRFLALESAAREAKSGLWSDPAYRVRAGDDSLALHELTGTMAVVEGRIGAVRAGRFRSYFPLGGTGRDAFVIMVDKRTLAQFTRSGSDTTRWVGRRVRVRGFLDDRFGLQIEVSSPDQVEFVQP